MNKTHHVVMWSGGITSWATARHVIAEHGKTNTTLVFSDTHFEDEDLHRWNNEAAAQLGMPFFTVADSKKRDPWQVFDDASWIGNTQLAQCSHLLKQIPTRKWLAKAADPASAILYLGVDWSETHRIRGIRKGYAHTTDGCKKIKVGGELVSLCDSLFDEDGNRRPGPGCANLLPVAWQVEFPLTRPPYRSKRQWFDEARAVGLRRPRLYDLGFEHNNCGGACVKGGQAQWARLLEVFPDRFAHVEAFEQRMRDRLGKDVSILRDRTGGTTTPLTLTALRERVERRKRDQPDLFSVLDAAPDDVIDTQDVGGCGCFTDDLAA